jgi:hypothetical protein
MNSQQTGRIMLIGPAPSRDSDPTDPLTPGRSNRGTGACLLRLLDMDLETFRMVFERHYLLPSHQGRHKGGDKLPRRLARKASDNMSESIMGRTVVLVGIKTARAFSIEHTAPFKWMTVAGANMAWIQNPSGINHWWNDHGNRKIGETFLSTLGQQSFNMALRGLAV